MRPPTQPETLAIRFLHCVFKEQASSRNIERDHCNSQHSKLYRTVFASHRSERLYFCVKAPRVEIDLIVLEYKERRNEPVRVKFLVEGTRREFGRRTREEEEVRGRDGERSIGSPAGKTARRAVVPCFRRDGRESPSKNLERTVELC
jgi:hypothetical protein